MRNRLGRDSKIYNALRGPSANDAQVTIVDNYNGEQANHGKYEWFEDESLFLYAGKRYCVEEEEQNKSAFNTLLSL